jgi:hypothetical protein
MPTYKQITTWTEYGSNLMTEILVFSDTYEGLDDLDGAPEVGIIEFDSTQRQLEIKTGIFAEDEISFSILEPAILSPDDAACANLILLAQDTTTRIFCARILSPADELLPVAGDFEFRGMVRSEMSAEDQRWYGEEYGEDQNPVRIWKCSAGAYTSRRALESRVDDLVRGIPLDAAYPGIPEAWFDANVLDRSGPFYSTGSDGKGHRELRYGELMRIDLMIQRLLDQAEIAAGDGVSYTYEYEELDLQMGVGRPKPFVTPDGWRMRYSLAPDLVCLDGTKITLGGEGIGSVWLSHRLMHPQTEAEEKVSWWRYETLAELLYDIGACLGLYLRIDYISSTDIRIRYADRQQIVGSQIFVRAPEAASIEVRPVDTGKDDAVWDRPPSLWQISEGSYIYDGTLRPLLPPSGGNPYPITVNPAMRRLERRGSEHGFDLGALFPFRAHLPHNAVFWNASGREAQNDPEKNAVGFTSQIFLKVNGNEDFGMEYGTTGRVVWAPAFGIHFFRNGVHWGLKTQQGYLQSIAAVDEASGFEVELELEVPGISPFRTDPLGTDDWRNLKLGSLYVQDGREYVVVKIERGALSTKISLHRSDRFAFQTGPHVYTPSEEPPISPGDDPPMPGNWHVPAGEGIVKHQIVTLVGGLGTPMKAMVCHAHHDFYRSPKLIALNDAALGDPVEVRILADRLTLELPGGITYPSGTRIFLRDILLVGGASAGYNLSDQALIATDDDEDLYFEVGVMEEGNAIRFLGVQSSEFVTYPPLP